LTEPVQGDSSLQHRLYGTTEASNFKGITDCYQPGQAKWRDGSEVYIGKVIVFITCFFLFVVSIISDPRSKTPFLYYLFIFFADAEHDWNITAHNGIMFRQKTLPPGR
jgi:hypothetical protein